MGRVRPVRTPNSISPIAVTGGSIPGFRLDVPVRFSRHRGSVGAPQKRLGFLARGRWDKVTHHSLVPHSRPGGPTILHKTHSFMAPRAETPVPGCEPAATTWSQRIPSHSPAWEVTGKYRVGRELAPGLRCKWCIDTPSEPRRVLRPPGSRSVTGVPARVPRSTTRTRREMRVSNSDQIVLKTRSA